MARTVSAVLLALALCTAPSSKTHPTLSACPPPPATAAGDTARPSAYPAAPRVPGVEETGLRFGGGELREPVAVAADARGFVYVADAMAGKVFRFDREGRSLEFSRPREAAAFYPIDVAVQESFVLVLDYAGNRLLRYDAKGSYLDVLVSFAEHGVRPVSITTGAGGRMITTDLENDAVALWTPLLEIELAFGEFGWGAGSFSEPRKAALLPRQEIVVVESATRRLQLFSPSGRFERTVREAGGREFASPRSIAADARGTVIVCDPVGKRLSLFFPSLEHVADIESFGGAPVAPAAAACGWDGTLYVADLASRSVILYRLSYPGDK